MDLNPIQFSPNMCKFSSTEIKMFVSFAFGRSLFQKSVKCPWLENDCSNLLALDGKACFDIRFISITENCYSSHSFLLISQIFGIIKFKNQNSNQSVR